MSFFEKLKTLLSSRRFWVSLIIVVTGVLGVFGVEAAGDIDPEETADWVLVIVNAVQMLVVALLPFFAGRELVKSYTVRPAGKDDN